TASGSGLSAGTRPSRATATAPTGTNRNPGPAPASCSASAWSSAWPWPASCCCRRSRLISTTRLILGGAPALVACQGDPVHARGTILFYHGLGASKEANARELEGLAAAGFLAVGLDNVGHGERRYPDYEQRFGEGSGGRWPEEFLHAVEATAQEVPAV